jgi:type IV secretory pathway TraG/TraD family ATPase VirD4
MQVVFVKILFLSCLLGIFLLPDLSNLIVHRLSIKEYIRLNGLRAWFKNRGISFFIGLFSLMGIGAVVQSFHLSWLKQNGQPEGLFCIAIYFILMLIWEVILKVYGQFRWGNRDSVIRGAQIADEEDCKQLRKEIKTIPKGTISFANLPVHLEAEMKHFKIIGTTGTGKSSVFREMIMEAMVRGDRTIVADPDGGYLANFYVPKRGDIILNPFDARSHTWALMDEIQSPHDVRLIAESLIPKGGEPDEWKDYARLFISSLLTRCKQENMGLNDFWRLAMVAPQEELRDFLINTPAVPYTEANNDKMFGSVRSVTSTYLASLEYVKMGIGEHFSIREWIKNGKGSLFMPYRSDQIAALRELISTWVRLAILETLRLEEKDNRLWFFVDELDALGQIGGMKDALARVRKYGGRMVLGFQSISQVNAIYREEAATIIENCANTLILRCSASEHGGTSRFVSELIGQQEISFNTVSVDPEGRQSRQQQITTEHAVLASEIEQLHDRSGFVKLADQRKWYRVNGVGVSQYQKIAKAFEEIAI